MRIYIKRSCGGQGLVSVEECFVAELSSIDFYLANSEEEFLKVVTRLEQLGKDKIESINNENSGLQTETTEKS